MGYDEPETLSCSISPICLKGADVRQFTYVMAFTLAFLILLIAVFNAFNEGMSAGSFIRYVLLAGVVWMFGRFVLFVFADK